MNIDPLFNAVSMRNPSFAGAFFNERGVMVVRLTRRADSTTTWQSVHDALASRIRTDPRRGKLAAEDTSVAPKGFGFEQAAASFTTLYQLKERIAARVFERDGTTFLDIDERLGRVVVGAASTSGISKARSLLTLTNEEDALVNVVLAARAVPTRQTTVFDHQRALAGGFEIGPRHCSMAVGIRRGTEHLAVTASHCTATIWSVDGGPLSQPLSGPSVLRSQIQRPIHVQHASRQTENAVAQTWLHITRSVPTSGSATRLAGHPV